MAIKMSTQVSDLTVKELEHLIETVIKRELNSLIRDPDAGFELREEIKERLNVSLASKKRIPLSEAKRKLRLA